MGVEILDLAGNVLFRSARARSLKEALQEAVGQDVGLRGAVLRCADLDNAVLVGIKLPEADLQSASLRGAVLESADLRRANLKWAILDDAIMARASMAGAMLHGASLRDADLRGTDLQDSDLRRADLTGARRGQLNIRGSERRSQCRRGPTEDLDDEFSGFQRRKAQRRSPESGSQGAP